jgi:hypothetical protein
MDHEQIIRAQSAKIIASGVLGRSKTYRRLFEYLVENSLVGRAPKELEIATDVFAKAADFDPTQDSMVRVYAHNLRQKLKQFYDESGASEQVRLSIPRGEYRLAVESVEAPPDPATSSPWRRSVGLWLALTAVGAVFVAGFALGRLGRPPTTPPVATTPLWSAIADDDLPILVVVGDYFILGEVDNRGDVVRFVREFSVNSAADLSAFRTRNPELGQRYQNLNTTYLARSTATALADVLRVLDSLPNRKVDVVTMSEFDPNDVRTSHIVYIGYFSALDKLLDFVFAGSTLAIGETFDELWNVETGQVFTSDAGRPADYRNYRDYGYFSTFSGPAGNEFVIIAGTRDEGVLHSAEAAADPHYVQAALPAIEATDSSQFELLYEVTGFDRTHIDAMLVHSGPIDATRIWRGALSQFDGSAN